MTTDLHVSTVRWSARDRAWLVTCACGLLQNVPCRTAIDLESLLRTHRKAHP